MKLDFRYQLEMEDLLRYQALSIEDRLCWLEEQLLFSQEFLPERNKRIRDAFRTGAELDAREWAEK